MRQEIPALANRRRAHPTRTVHSMVDDELRVSTHKSIIKTLGRYRPVDLETPKSHSSASRSRWFENSDTLAHQETGSSSRPESSTRQGQCSGPPRIRTIRSLRERRTRETRGVERLDNAPSQHRNGIWKDNRGDHDNAHIKGQGWNIRGGNKRSAETHHLSSAPVLRSRPVPDPRTVPDPGVGQR